MERVRKHVVRLTAEQRGHVESVVRNGQATAKMINHARVLLLCDQDHPEGRWRDAQVAAMLGLHLNTIKRIRKLFITAGLDPALRREPRADPPVAPKLDGAAEAHLVALCCSPPPPGRVRWTLRLLAEELPRRGVVSSVCRETVRRALKKTR
jgi:transposase